MHLQVTNAGVHWLVEMPLFRLCRQKLDFTTINFKWKKVKLFLRNLHSLVVKHEDVLVSGWTDSQRDRLRIAAFPQVWSAGISCNQGGTIGFMSKGSMDLVCKYYLSGLTRKHAVSTIFKQWTFCRLEKITLTDSAHRNSCCLVEEFWVKNTALGRLFVPNFCWS